MDIKHFIREWLIATNAFDTKKYLSFYLENAVFGDPSVAKEFEGHSGIRKYFEDYFIGYETQTKLIILEVISHTEAHIEVDFTGEVPGGQLVNSPTAQSLERRL